MILVFVIGQITLLSRVIYRTLLIASCLIKAGRVGLTNKRLKINIRTITCLDIGEAWHFALAAVVQSQRTSLHLGYVTWHCAFVEIYLSMSTDILFILTRTHAKYFLVKETNHSKRQNMVRENLYIVFNFGAFQLS